MLLALIQAATEFLPISSSGHLALISNLISEPNVSFFVTLHLASLFAVVIFTRKEIYSLLKFDKPSLKLWIYLIIATIPAVLVGFFSKSTIEAMFSSYFFLGIAFIFTGIIIILTKFSKTNSKLNIKNSFVIGLFQVLALFPGVSRSGMTISSGMFFGIPREKAAKFSFLLLIPLTLGAFLLEINKINFSIKIIPPLLVCLAASLLFLNLLMKIIIKEKFWVFSIYCFILGIVSLIISILL